MKISDENFLDLVDKSLIAFAKGDILRVQLKTRQFQTLEGLKTEYDRNKDVFKGIDHEIIYKNQRFFIHCYVNTKAGKEGRFIKNKRHDFKGIHLDVEMDMGKDSAKKVGDFFLYSSSHIKHLIELMDKELEFSSY